MFSWQGWFTMVVVTTMMLNHKPLTIWFDNVLQQYSSTILVKLTNMVHHVPIMVGFTNNRRAIGEITGSSLAISPPVADPWHTGNNFLEALRDLQYRTPFSDFWKLCLHERFTVMMFGTPAASAEQTARTSSETTGI